MEKEITYHVIINRGTTGRWTKEFPSRESALLEVERLKNDTSFNKVTFKAIKKTVIEETIKH